MFGKTYTKDVVLIVYIGMILSWYITGFHFLKSFPCLFLFTTTHNPAFFYAAVGDFLLEEYLIPAVVCFTVATCLLGPTPSWSIKWMSVAGMLQPVIAYLFSPVEILVVDLYILSLANLLSYETVFAYIYVLADIFVLLQLAGYPQFQLVSLPLYWTAMAGFAL